MCLSSQSVFRSRTLKPPTVFSLQAHCENDRHEGSCQITVGSVSIVVAMAASSVCWSHEVPGEDRDQTWPSSVAFSLSTTQPERHRFFWGCRSLCCKGAPTTRHTIFSQPGSREPKGSQASTVIRMDNISHRRAGAVKEPCSTT